MGRPTAFNEPVFAKLLDALRRGAFDWVAAEAAGISRSTFYRGLARGEKGEQPFDLFAREVKRAKAEARLQAEARVHDEHPLSWLRLGPGRERRGQPGWTEAAKAQVDRPPEEQVGHVDPELEAEMQRALEDLEREEADEAEGDDR